jgi:hypothetical protein
MNRRRTKDLLFRWHLPGMLFGSGAFRAVSWLGDTPGHRGHFSDLGPWAVYLAAFAVLTPFFVGHLILWDRVTKRFPAIESVPLVRALGLVSLAVVVAATLQLLLMTGAGLYIAINDSTPFTDVWKERPIDYLTSFGVLLSTTLSWCIIPRVLIRLSPVGKS